MRNPEDEVVLGGWATHAAFRQAIQLAEAEVDDSTISALEEDYEG